jgi:hypothetical protein
MARQTKTRVGLLAIALGGALTLGVVSLGAELSPNALASNYQGRQREAFDAVTEDLATQVAYSARPPGAEEQAAGEFNKVAGGPTFSRLVG